MRLSPKQGSVYYFYNEDLEADYPHWHIVLNLKPLDDDGCHVVICTSKVEALRKAIAKGKYKPDTVVFVPPDAYPKKFTKETGIDCHKVFFINEKRLEAIQANAKKYRYSECPDFPADYLTKIVDGVLLSFEHDDVIRAALLGVEVKRVPDAMFERFGMKLKVHLPTMYAKVSAKNTYMPPKGGLSIVVTPGPASR